MKCNKNNFGLSAALFLATLFFCFVTLPQELFPQSSFFQGKTITIIQGRDPGGTGDLRVRAFRLTGQTSLLPPGTPKDRVAILQEAFRKAYRDPEFHKEYKQLTTDDATPLMPEEQEKAIREIPRDPETAEIFKKLVGAGPLPSR
jgi:hypothetical protein